MPDTAFDRWTRRRFGQAAGALIAAPVLAGAALPTAAKKHHKKKKKCLKIEDGQCQGIGNPCNPYGSPCCDCIKCRQTEEEVPPTDEFDLPDTILVYTCAP